MSTEQPGRTSRQNSPGSPMGSTIAIVVTVVAVILGFFILKQIRDDSEGGGTVAPVATSTTSSSVAPASTDPQITTTTELVLVTQGTKVQVANASSQNGVAGQLSTALSGEGFDMSDATNAAVKLDLSKVLYDQTIPEAKAVADSVASVMGGIPVEVAPTPPPTVDGALPDGTGVLVMLGNDKAGKTLAQMQAPADTTGTTSTTTG